MAKDDEITPLTDAAGQLPNAAQQSRSGRAISPSIVENVEELPSSRPSFDDCYTISLHNLADDQALSVCEHSGIHARDCSAPPIRP